MVCNSYLSPPPCKMIWPSFRTMFSQEKTRKPKKSQQTPAKTHTKIAADAKNPRKASKNHQKHIQKRRGRQKPKKKQQKLAKTYLIHII